MNQAIAFVALGANLGDRQGELVRAILALHGRPGTRVLGVSRLHETRPVGPPPQGPYLNAVLAAATRLGPEAFLAELAALERAAGRTRDVPDGPRTLDLDLLAYAPHLRGSPNPGPSLHVASRTLVLPHPRLADRDFVLAPWAELCPTFVPGVVDAPHGTIRQLLQARTRPGESTTLLGVTEWHDALPARLRRAAPFP